jgi:hypothetical protein
MPDRPLIAAGSPTVTRPRPAGSPARPPVPWIDRLVSSPTVRSGYTSAVVHLVLLSVLAIMLIERPARERPRRLELSFATTGDAAGHGGAVAPPALIELAGPEPREADEPARADPADRETDKAGVVAT